MPDEVPPSRAVTPPAPQRPVASGLRARLQNPKLVPLWALLASFGAALLFTLTPLWQLALVAGAIGGLFCVKMKWGAIAGCLGTALAWLLYIGISFAISQSDDNLALVAGIMFDDTSLGGVMVLLVALIGGLFGALGGSIGSGARQLINARKSP